MSEPTLDLDRVLRLRLVVARFGEMDLARWWNTKNQLGKHGPMALRRGFPRTHLFAQARSVFAVAAHRCAEVLGRPRDITLWHLPEAVEEELDTRWERWIDTAGDWSGFFQSIEAVKGDDLPATLRSFDLASARDIERLRRLQRAPEARAVALADLVRERTSAAVREALRGLLAAPQAGGAGRKGRRGAVRRGS